MTKYTLYGEGEKASLKQTGSFLSVDSQSRFSTTSPGDFVVLTGLNRSDPSKEICLQFVSVYCPGFGA